MAPLFVLSGCKGMDFFCSDQTFWHFFNKEKTLTPLHLLYLNIFSVSSQRDMKKYLFIFFLSLGLTARAQGGDLSLPEKNSTGCRMVKIEAERLPDLNIPRCGHSF